MEISERVHQAKAMGQFKTKFDARIVTEIVSGIQNWVTRNWVRDFLVEVVELFGEALISCMLQEDNVTSMITRA